MAMQGGNTHYCLWRMVATLTRECMTGKAVTLVLLCHAIRNLAEGGETVLYRILNMLPVVIAVLL